MGFRPASLAGGLLFSAPLLAHTGHGRHGGDFSLLHYLSEPQHVAGVALLLALVIGGAVALWQRRAKRRD